MINLKNIPADAELVTATLNNGVTLEVEAITVHSQHAITVHFKGATDRLYNNEGVNQYRPEYNIQKITVQTPRKVEQKIFAFWIPRFFRHSLNVTPAKKVVMYSGLMQTESFEV